MDFDTLASVMVEEYDSDARQLAVHSELDRITLARVMSDNDIADLDTGLTTLVEKINVLTPQCPAHFRSDENKLRFLRNAVIRQEWAQPAISQITTARFSYNALVTALREQLQLSEEKKELLNPSRTMYQQYGRNPRSIPRNHNNMLRASDINPSTGKKKNPIGRDGKRMLCRICAADDHFANRCTPGALTRNVQEKLGQGVPAVHVLSEVISQIDTEYRQADADEPSTDDAKADHGNELDTFNELIGNTNADDDMTPAAETSFSQAMDEARATHHIASVMNDVMNDTSAEDIQGQWDPTIQSFFQ